MNSATNAAFRNSAIQIFATGLGATDPPLATGQPGNEAEPLNRTVIVPTVSIGGTQAEVLFAGAAPGFVGLYQVNAIIPVTSQVGNAVSLQIAAGGQTSNVVSIAVQRPRKSKASAT
jgi:uncharacterized protein (TIGR03437 family)